MESRILLTGAELNLFTLLASQSMTAEEIQAHLGADRRALTMVLDALAAMGLLTKQDGKYRTEPSAAPLLSEDAPGSVLPMVLHSANLWHSWSRLTDMARGPDAGAQAAASEEDRMRAFIGAMHVAASPQAAQIVAAVDPGSARRLIDVGGGPGTYTIAFLKASPGMRATLFDRPGVVEMARERIGQAGLLDRVTLVPGDFSTDPLPPGHDLAFVSAIIHMNSPAQNLDLYRKTYDALEAGGRIVIRDHVMEPDRIRPRAGAIFAINMLVNTAGGGTYTFEEIADGLTQAGFTRVRRMQQGERMDALVEAFKP
jgi:precorrin-6B methylase 2